MTRELDVYARIRIIYKYTHKLSLAGKNKMRKMTADDLKTISAYREIYKQLGILIAECLTIINIIRRLNNPYFQYVASNLSRAVNSLKRQRIKSYEIRIAFYSIKPDMDEAACVKIFLAEAKDRINNVHTNTIPSNLKYTPLKEYLNIRKIDRIYEDLCEWFDDVTNIVEAQNSEVVMSEYLSHILEVVQTSGKMSDYEDRLTTLISQKEQAIALSKRQADQQKAKQLRPELEDGMAKFREMFYQSVYSMKSEDQIKIGRKMIIQKINTCGRGCFFILCCYIVKKRFVYRYIGEDDQLVDTFGKAHAFKDKTKALETIKRVQAQNLKMIFDIVKL